MSWVDDFLELTEHIPSPPIFRKWAAISVIAAAMERKVWVRTYGSHLYPNLYVILVAPPGVGKTEVTWRARDMISSLTGHHIAHSSVTKASLIDNLNDATRSVTRPEQVPAVLAYHSLFICQNELGVLIPAYDNEFMNTLTDLYDGKPYSEKRRTRAINIEIAKPNLNMLAACTPAYLTSTLPEGAWDQGFTSRILLIYSGEGVKRSLFAETEENEELDKVMREDLVRIGDMSGKMAFSQEAADMLDAWHLNDGEPKPDHPRLHHYNTRRTAQVIKLSMIASAAEGADMVIQLSHVQQALDWLAEAEMFMPDIFKAMANTSHSQLLEEIYHYVYKTYHKENRKGVSEPRLVNFISQRTPAHNVDRILEVLVKAGFLRKEIGTSSVVYIPLVPT